MPDLLKLVAVAPCECNWVVFVMFVFELPNHTLRQRELMTGRRQIWLL